MKKLLYFSADWCEPCKQLDILMEELSQENINIQKINVDTNPDAADGFRIQNIPTVVLTIDGVDSGRKVGLNHRSMYIELYNQN
jgi:thioredoxin 1|tara:strand:+ start:592 stop:843 length:252 start_codon:yes stop_codon:yes gene_type:complete